MKVAKGKKYKETKKQEEMEKICKV